MITNLKEFFASRGFGTEENMMYAYGRALYKSTFGPWIVYLVETSPAQDIEYSIIIKRDDTGNTFLVPGGVVPEDIASFFLINHDLGMNTFDEYAELIEEHHTKHKNLNWDFTLCSDTLVITGTHTIPQKIREVYYESDSASTDTLKLADKVIGIRVGSIIEGADYDATPFELYFPFEADEFERNFDELDSEVDEEWKKNNTTYFKITRVSDEEEFYYGHWVAHEGSLLLWGDDDAELQAVAVAGCNALFDGGDKKVIPGYPDWIVNEETVDW